MNFRRNINGAAVRAIRTSMGLSGRQLAALSFITPPFLHRIETGQRQASIETQAAIAKALGVPVEAITQAALPAKASA